MLKNYLKVLVFFVFAVSSSASCSTNNQQNINTTASTTMVTTTKMGLFKEYVCSTLSILAKSGSVFFSVGSVLLFLHIHLDQSMSEKERIKIVKSIFFCCIPASIVLWKTGDFLAKLAKI